MTAVLFATPDFGASGPILGLALSAFATVVAIGFALFWFATRMISSQRVSIRRWGGVVLLVSITTLCSPFFVPPLLVRIACGNFPISQSASSKIGVGMSTEQVVSMLGNPHSRYENDDGSTWIYWYDSLSTQYFFIDFDENNRVTDFANHS